jgi:hypothetical protein
MRFAAISVNIYGAAASANHAAGLPGYAEEGSSTLQGVPRVPGARRHG